MEYSVPILHVADATISVDWYGRLGFVVDWEHVFEPGLPRYVALNRGPARLHLSEHRLDGGEGTHVYVYADDVDAVVSGVAVAVEDRPWGMREARLTDPDGNVIRLGTRSTDSIRD
ncbi:MAG TPA: glyoxalase superfamily protein [Amycolatopsis sp.]|nr:glyoxalase superfamily protein [Amycolatopsis sp.]